jgi:formate dehydrogenase maturation protein FdhE
LYNNILLSVLASTDNSERLSSIKASSVSSHNFSQKYGLKQLRYESDGQFGIENDFVKILEKKLLANIYGHVLGKLSSSINHMKVFEEMNLEQLIDNCFKKDSSQSSTSTEETKRSQKLLSKKRAIRDITGCPHVDRKHYAKVIF